MDFNLSTPALLFSAISLLMLAYTNRFLAIANLTRESVKAYQENKSSNTLKQIRHFKIRLRLIKLTQVFGVVSFLICTVSMFVNNGQIDYICGNTIYCKLVIISNIINAVISRSLDINIWAEDGT